MARFPDYQEPDWEHQEAPRRPQPQRPPLSLPEIIPNRMTSPTQAPQAIEPTIEEPSRRDRRRARKAAWQEEIQNAPTSGAALHKYIEGPEGAFLPRVGRLFRTAGMGEGDTLLEKASSGRRKIMQMGLDDRQAQEKAAQEKQAKLDQAQGLADHLSGVPLPENQAILDHVDAYSPQFRELQQIDPDWQNDREITKYLDSIREEARGTVSDDYRLGHLAGVPTTFKSQQELAQAGAQQAAEVPKESLAYITQQKAKFNADRSVQDFNQLLGFARTTQRVVDNINNAANTAGAKDRDISIMDYSLLNAMAKAFDPSGRITGSDIDTPQHIESVAGRYGLERIAAKVLRGEVLSPAQRAQVISAVQEMTKDRSKDVQSLIDDYRANVEFASNLAGYPITADQVIPSHIQQGVNWAQGIKGVDPLSEFGPNVNPQGITKMPVNFWASILTNPDADEEDKEAARKMLKHYKVEGF